MSEEKSLNLKLPKQGDLDSRINEFLRLIKSLYKILKKYDPPVKGKAVKNRAIVILKFIVEKMQAVVEAIDEEMQQAWMLWIYAVSKVLEGITQEEDCNENLATLLKTAIETFDGWLQQMDIDLYNKLRYGGYDKAVNQAKDSIASYLISKSLCLSAINFKPFENFDLKAWLLKANDSVCDDIKIKANKQEHIKSKGDKDSGSNAKGSQESEVKDKQEQSSEPEREDADMGRSMKPVRR